MTYPFMQARQTPGDWQRTFTVACVGQTDKWLSAERRRGVGWGVRDGECGMGMAGWGLWVPGS